MSDSGFSLPLYLSRTVLPPDGGMTLRLIEPRHLSMLSECCRHGHGFGICLLMQSDVAGTSATPASVGTEALIRDFFLGADGVLNIEVFGGRRFHIEQARVRHDGVLTGTPHWRAHAPVRALPPRYALLAKRLPELREQRYGPYAAHVVSEQLDDAEWVGWRLLEAMPLTELERQALLEEDDLEARLDRLLHRLL